MDQEKRALSRKDDRDSLRRLWWHRYRDGELEIPEDVDSRVIQGAVYRPWARDKTHYAINDGTLIHVVRMLVSLPFLLYPWSGKYFCGIITAYRPEDFNSPHTRTAAMHSNYKLIQWSRQPYVWEISDRMRELVELPKKTYTIQTCRMWLGLDPLDPVVEPKPTAKPELSKARCFKCSFQSHEVRSRDCGCRLCWSCWREGHNCA